MYQWGIEGESYTVDASGNKSYTEQAGDNDWLQQLGINPSFVFPAQQSVVSTDALVADWHAECNAWQEQFIAESLAFPVLWRQCNLQEPFLKPAGSFCADCAGIVRLEKACFKEGRHAKEEV